MSVTTAPPPGRFAAVARPPCAPATACTSASPRPAAPRVRATSARVKRSNACGRNAGGKACSLVRNADGDAVVVLPGRQADRPRAVPKRVVDEIAQRLLQPQPVAGDDEARRRVDLDCPAGDRESSRDRVEQLTDLERLLPQPQLTFVRARQDEQVLREPHETLGLLGCRGERGVKLLGTAGPAERDLELGLQQRERRPELVARIGNEAALALEPGFEPCEHRSQRRRREHVARERGEQQHERASEQELRPQGGERIVSIVERCAGNDDQLVHGRREEAHIFVLDHNRLAPCAVELVGREERRRADAPRGVPHLAAGTEHLREALVALREPPRHRARSHRARGRRRRPRAFAAPSRSARRAREPSRT